MLENIAPLLTVAICLGVFVYYQLTKRKEWNAKDAEESNRKILAKPCADVINSDQVAMAELKIEIEAHKINDLFDDALEAERLSKIVK